MTVDSKNWSNFKNNAPYPIPEGFIKVDSLDAFSKNEKLIRKILNIKSSTGNYDDLVAKIHSNQILYLLTKTNFKEWRGKNLKTVSVIASIWGKDNYLHSLIFDDSIDDRGITTFIHSCCNFIIYKYINVECDPKLKELLNVENAKT